MPKGTFSPEKISKWLDDAKRELPGEHRIPSGDKEGRQKVKKVSDAIDDAKGHFDKFADKEQS